MARVGNQNLQYAKSAKRQNVGTAGEIFNENDLNMVKNEREHANKRDQLIILNQKVKQFEEKVARDEKLMRNNPGGTGDNNGGMTTNNAILEA